MKLLRYLWSLRLIFVLGFIGGFCGMWTYVSLTKVLHDSSFEALIKECNDLTQELEQKKDTISRYEKIFKRYDVYLKEKEERKKE